MVCVGKIIKKGWSWCSIGACPDGFGHFCFMFKVRSFKDCYSKTKNKTFTRMVCFSKVSIVLAVKKKRIFYVYFNHLMVSRQ